MLDSIMAIAAPLSAAVLGTKLMGTPGVEVNTSSLNGRDECSDDYENDGSKLLVCLQNV